MNAHADYAEALFKQGYNCAQSVFAAFHDELGIKLNIALNLKKSATIDLEIQDLTGRLIFVENYSVNGNELIQIDLTDIPSGIYLIKINAGDESLTRRIIKD